MTSVDCNNFPHYDSLVTAEYVHVTDEDESDKLVNKEDVGWEYEREYGIPDTVGWTYEFEIRDMIAACNNYLNKVGVSDDRRFLINEHGWEWFDMSPNGALGSLRTGFCAAIQSVEKDYSLKYGKDIR